MQAPDDIGTPPRSLSHADYTVGWICALPKELAASQAMLDQEHVDLPRLGSDPNTYTLGSVGNHNVVMVCLPSGQYGTNSAANVLTQMIRTFPSIRFGLMVGIGGGVPPRVRLGDIVVSIPSNTFPGVVQWDLGKSEKGGFERTGALNHPPQILLTALAKMEAIHRRKGSKMLTYMKEMEEKYPVMVGKYTWSSRLKDPLLEPYQAQRAPDLWPSMAVIIYEMLLVLVTLLSGRHALAEKDVPSMCDSDSDDRKPRGVKIHYGLIASGNQVIKDSAARDQINRDLGGKVLCFEMEAAGLMSNFPCIVIRGICDYADAQKNKDWQEYAAALAAAFTKELLQHVHCADVARQPSIKDALQQVHGVVMDTHAKVSAIESHMNQDEVTRILDWLTTADHGQQHTMRLGRHQKGTCQWIFKTEELQSWLNGRNKTLLCQGMPGAGKSITTSVVIDHLTTRFMDDSTIGIAYLYCTFSHEKTQTTEQLLASVLRQLASGCVSFPSSTKRLYEQHKPKDTYPSQEQLVTAVEDVAKLHSKVYLAIDGIDECHLPSIRRFLRVLFDLQARCTINILGTSRYIPDIAQWFKRAKSSFLEIRACSRDIDMYLEAEMQHSSTNTIEDDEQIQGEIKTEISKAAGGMFLLAHIYMSLLRDKTTVYDIRAQLESFKFSAGVRSDNVLTDAYHEVLDRIDKQEKGLRDLAAKVLLWLTLAKRELTTAEVRHAVATIEGMKTIGQDRLPHIRDIGRVCVGMIAFDEKSGIIQLVHYTAQEFFERNYMSLFPEAHSAIFKTCITYLSFSDFDSGLCQTDEEFELRRQSFPLCNYAASHWGDHVPKDAQPSPALLEFLDSTAKVEASVQAQHAVKHYPSHTHYSQEVPRKVTGLHLAAQFGLHGLAKALLEDEEKASPNSLDSDNQTPLLWAVRKGCEEIVKLLMDANAELEVRDRDQGATALIWAVRNGHENIIHLLLQRGSELNARDHLQRTPLSLAAHYKHESIINLLLAKGGLIHPHDDAGKVKLLGTRLKHPMVMEMLFGHEYRPACVVNGEDNAAPYTAEYRPEMVMQRLLNADDSINEVDQQGRTLLSRAAESGDAQLVEMLISTGKAKIDASDRDYGDTPLIWAAKQGHDAIVRLLLKAGANVNVKERREGETALTLAIENGHEAIVRVLLDNGANVNNRDHTNHTPLHTTSWHGSEALMQLLLERGVDVNAGNHEGLTPVFSACAFGHIDLVRMLLDAGADIEARDKERRTPLFFAAALGNSDIVQLLLERGANIRARNKDGRTAMFAAIGSGSTKVVDLLLDVSHIDVHGADEEGVKPIDWAEEGGNKDIILRLRRARTI